MPSFLTDPYWIVSGLAALAGLLAAIIPPIQTAMSKSSKQLTYKVHSNASLVEPNLKSGVTIRLNNGNVVTDADLLVLSIMNTGNTTIEQKDYINKLTFQFIDRNEIIDIILAETTPAAGQIYPNNINRLSPNKIVLDRPLINTKNSIKLSILARGPRASKEEIQDKLEVTGGLIGGEVVPYRPPLRIQGKYVVSAIGVLLLVAVFVATSIHLSPPSSTAAANCTSGSLAMGGSTALLPLVSTTARTYHDICPGATISLNQNVASSKAGLSALESGDIQIGDSDLLSSNLSLVDYKIAAVIYVMVVNQDVPKITDLSMAQIRGIYNGSITNWRQVGGPNLPIFVINRTTTSGTRATFEKYLLGGKMTAFPPNYDEEDTSELMAQKVANTAGAIGYVDVRDALTTKNLRTLTINGMQAVPDNVINNSYDFWTIEHMYTQGNPSGLASAFVQYIAGKELEPLISALNYIPFNDMPAATINSHPSPTAPDDL